MRRDIAQNVVKTNHKRHDKPVEFAVLERTLYSVQTSLCRCSVRFRPTRIHTHRTKPILAFRVLSTKEPFLKGSGMSRPDEEITSKIAVIRELLGLLRDLEKVAPIVSSLFRRSKVAGRRAAIHFDWTIRVTPGLLMALPLLLVGTHLCGFWSVESSQDILTGVGDRRVQDLNNSVRVQINELTELSLTQTATRQHLVLKYGEVSVEAKAALLHPFRVTTPDVRIESSKNLIGVKALRDGGSEVIVSKDGGDTVIYCDAALTGSFLTQTSLTLHPGQRVRVKNCNFEI